MKLFTTITTYCGLLVAGGATKRDIATLVLGILSAIASGVPFPLIGIVFGQLLNDFNQATCEHDDAIPASYQDSVNQKILLIFYLAIAQFVLIYCHLCCWSLGGARLAQRLREQYLRSLLKQEPLYFSKFPPGEVSARLNGDIQTIRSGTSEKVGIVLASLSFFVTAYIVAFIKDYKLSAELLSLVPAFLLMSFVGSHYVEKYAGIMSDASASAASIALEALSNMVLVQSFRANARLEKRFAQALEIAEAQGIRKAFATGVQAGVLYFVAYSANALAFWQGSVRIASSINEPGTDANVGSVFTVVFVLIEATLLMSQVAPFLHIFASAVASYRKLQEELLRESLIQDSKQAQVLSDRPLKGSFEFRNVIFRYPARPDVTVVDGISLTVEARKHTAIVGLSGSGKSTLVGLMLRLFDAMDGTVYLDGHDVRDLRLEDVRRTSSVVPQNAALLDRSLLENIAYGLISSSHSEHHALLPTLLGPGLGILAEELREGKEIGAAALAHGQEIAEIVKLVRDAAIMADADSFISAMDHGYGTLAGPGGQSISGGQKQRVALARALVKDPAVLILDEATASLDSVSEVKIQNAIALASSGRTTLTIAHRLSTIRNADKIVVMHAGKVVEHGSHAELLSHNGRYAELVRLQTMSSTTPGQDDVLTPKRQMNSTEGAQKKAELQVREDAVVDPSQSKPPSVNGTHEFPGSFAKLFARTFWPVLRPHLLMTALAFASAVIVGATFSGEAVIFGNTVGALSPCNPVPSIEASGRFFGLMFFILALIEFFASIISWSGFGFVSSKSVRALRSTLFNSMLDQDLAWHQKKGTSPAGLLSYITRDCEAWAGLSGSVIGTICSITLNLLAAIIMTHIIAWRIALVTLSLVPLLLGSGLMELRVLGRFEEKHETAYSSSVEIGVESVTNINVIATFSLEQLTMQTYSRSLAGPRKETLRVTLQASFWQATMYFLGNCINALAYWWGSKQIATGNYTQVQFLIVVFSLLVGALLWAQMFALAPELTSAKAAIMRIARIMSIAREGQATDALIRTGSGSDSDIEAKAESKGTPKGVSGPAGVRFHDVQFAYPARPDSQVLHGLNITICPGQLCALVGPSGAGKSTIIQLVLGLYRPQTGSVWIDGTCLTNRADVTFRDRFAIVPQENTLFEGTVAFNIGLGARPDEVADQDEIEHACKLAGIHETIMNLPDKYDTLCGTNGNQFSGGQRQRLSIARALVRQPDLLILDEPSSALDAESEKLLQQSLEIVAKTATVIVIAHRLHTIRSADVIFMIENGQCTARGTHEELLQSSPAYRTNVMHQMVADPDS